MLIELGSSYCVSNIRFLRRKYMLSRRALARLIGMSVYVLRDIETEAMITVFSERQLKRLCSIFDVPLEALIHKDLSQPQEVASPLID